MPAVLMCLLVVCSQPYGRTFAFAVSYEYTVVAHLVPCNLSSHTSFVMCLHCREHGEWGKSAVERKWYKF